MNFEFVDIKNYELKFTFFYGKLRGASNSTRDF